MPLLRFGEMDYVSEKLISIAHREIEVLKKLQHKNMVKYLGIIRKQDSLNIIQEYMPQYTL